MSDKKKYLVTSALPYANGPLHIGHLAGAYLPADVFVRYMKGKGEDVCFVCGSDEHGAAITIRAKKDGVSPQDIVDRYDALIKETFEKVNIDFDIYHRTSSELHHQTAQDFFRVLNDNGEFVKETTEQYFDEEADQFLADRYIIGTCPKCNNEDAYGDQCEKCGSTLSPTELIHPKSTLSGSSPVLRSTTHWFLPLDKYEDWLRPFLVDGKLNGAEHHNPHDWKAHVLGQCRSWLDNGLQPRAMTRDLSWGVDVPQEIEGSEGKKLYVWLDAPIGYISATKQWAADNGKNWEEYWKGDDAELIHFIGKDNIVFHCVIFPVILNAHGGFILPKNVPANQFLNLEGRKISTSKNWAIWVHEYVEDFKEQPEMIDVLRYYMIKTMPENKDSEFTWKGFQEANNAELVGNLANFVNRVVVLTNKYYNGVVPQCDTNLEINCSAEEGKTSTYARELAAIKGHLDKIGGFIESYNFRDALKEVLALSSLGNQLLQFNAPWSLIKTDEEVTKVVMNLGVQVVGALSEAVRPFLPETSDRLRTLLGIENPKSWDKVLSALTEDKPILESNHQIGKPLHLFTKLDDKWVTEQVQKLEDSQVTEVSYPELKEETSFDDFQKMDLRTGTIVEAEKVKKAKKLLKLQVDLGFETRTVVSGIAEFFKPEDVVGQEVVLLANLAPRKIRGVESQGMILMAENEKGELGFVSPAKGFGNGFNIS